MVILGIDPGFSITGFCILKKEQQKIVILHFGALRFSSNDSLAIRIGEFHTALAQKIREYGITTIALETPFLGKNAQNFLKLGYLRGILYLLANQHALSLVEFTPSQVKMAVTGSGASPKIHVAHALLRLFPGLTLPEKLDITDAVAVALCGMWHSSTSSVKNVLLQANVKNSLKRNSRSFMAKIAGQRLGKRSLGKQLLNKQPLGKRSSKRSTAGSL